MDPYIANLNFDPPKHTSELALGLLPALLLNTVFFGIVLFGAQGGDVEGPAGGSEPLALTREMGGPPASPPAPEAAAQRPAPAAEAIREAPPMSAARDPVAPPTQVAKAEPQPSAAARVASATPRVSPSFDCSRARLKTEKLICRDPDLAQQDRELGRLYAQAKAAAPDPAAFKRQSDREWARREAECGDKACLQRWYAERRAQLQASLAGRRQATGTPTR